MKKQTVLILVNIAAFLFLAMSICVDRNWPEIANLLIPCTILFGSNLYCLIRITKDDE